MNGTTAEHGVSYGYDAAGRLAGVHTGATYPSTPDFSYNYLANSGSLLESVTGPAHTVTNSYEANRNVLQQKRNTAGDSSQITNTPISNFIYSVNALGQRDDVSRSGSAFASANTETWNYNAKGELVTANHSTNDAADRAYQFDEIGNRVKSADSLVLPTAPNYVANNLNQLTSVEAVARTHDDDGNILDDGSKIYVWDAESRLKEVKDKGTNTTLVSYVYDYQSRRISKTAGGVTTNYLYEGWNPIAEYSGSTLSKTYTWGMDLSGSMQGAGGVGGLLSVNDGSATYYPTYDGNGNVSEYVAATGAVVAHYEYDAFGQATPSTANMKSFTHQFSTKQLDTETGLNYYGYRYYDSSHGRWLGRDPIEENGGLNIYVFVLNNSTYSVDRLGLVKTWTVVSKNKKGGWLFIEERFNGIGDYGQPGYCSIGIEGENLCGVTVCGRYGGGNNCNTVIPGPTGSSDGSAAFVYAKLEEGEKECKYEFKIKAHIQGQIWGPGTGVTYNVDTTDDNLFGNIGNGASDATSKYQMFSKGKTMTSVVSMKKGVTYEILTTDISVRVMTGKPNSLARGIQTVEVISDKMIGGSE